MRNLRKAVVVVAMVGSMGTFGAGVAAAGGHGGSGGGDFLVNNPQMLNCAYTENTNTALTQTATSLVSGDATNTATLGNVCVQTGPTFEF